MFLPPRDDDQEWFGVLVAIPEPWVSALTQARIDLGDELGARVPAHITLMPPVAVPKEARTEVIRHLRDVAQRHAPFRISLKGSGTFLPISPVAFVNVDEGAAACANLAEDIRSGPLDHPARFPYHPHVTLAQGVSEDVIARALHLARGFEASWLVPGFRLDQVDERGTYHSQALFDFEASTTGMDAPTKRTRSRKSHDNK
ncbi:MAG: 2'-5' RNA ligase family protein [Actinomycetaceae bacterium]|nr:2'-5' RNA ligase family protein [Actinomycetaceae bacterium]